MADIFLEWNTDIAIDANGDLLLSDGRDQSNQRVIRRLLTNPGDYVWNLSYGGGLALAVGAPINAARIEATARQQLAMEASISASPPPLVNVNLIDQARGAFSVDISYTAGSTGGPAKVSIVQR